MSEALLQALMQLFAMASSDDDITQESRTVVENWLKSELSQNYVEKYLLEYDHYINVLHGNENQDKNSLEDYLNSFLQEFSKSLVQKQRVVILLRLLEYIFADGNISQHELDFLTKLSKEFNISTHDFKSILAFAESDGSNRIESDRILYIEDKRQQKKALSIHTPHFEGVLMFIHIPSVKLFAMRYFGNSDVFLNGQIVAPNKPYILSNGSSIRGSKFATIYYSSIQAAMMKFEHQDDLLFEGKTMEFEFSKGVKGLHSFSFSETSGSLIGIMGGSGAGKSTLLNLLNGTLIPTSGEVLLNGIDIHKNPDHVKGVIGHVSQDDLLMEDLTVFENLYFNAKLCFAHLNDEEVKKRVYKTLRSLGLSEVTNLKVGSPINKVISGGQRKRLNIALELIREPDVLFVDEPTSGLSSRDSENIMDLLKQLTLKGKLIYVVIHQPSSEIFKLFNKLILLDIGGFPIYYGDPVDAVRHFKIESGQVNQDLAECHSCGNVNPEQIFNIVETKVVDEFGNQTNTRKTTPKEWYQVYQKQEQIAPNIDDKTTKPLENKLHTPSFLGQLLIFIKRDVLSKLANKQYLLITFLEAPVLGLILSYFIKFSDSTTAQTKYSLLLNENLPAYIFMSVVVALFLGLTVSAEEIIRDARIRQRERFLNLSRFSYLMAKSTILMFISAIQTITFVLIGNFVMEIEGMTLIYWLVLFSTAVCANVMGLNVSASFNSAVTIYIIIPFLIIPQLIFSGVIVKFQKLNPKVSSEAFVPFIGEVMPSRWAFEALSVSQFKDNDLEKRFFELDKDINLIKFKKVYWTPTIYAKLNLLEQNIDNEKGADTYLLISNEITKTNAVLGIEKFDFKPFEELNLDDIQGLRSYLDKLKKKLNRTFVHYLERKDDVIYSISQENPENPDHYKQLKEKYTNKSLKDLVTNHAELNKTIEVNHEILQQENPIYRDAKNTRAHFYAPNKIVFNKKVDTLWFNIIVLWTMTILFWLLLYFNGLRTLLGLFKSPKVLFKEKV